MLKYKEYHQKSPQYDLLLKKNEQMYALLAICLSLCPQTNLIDENVSIELKGKYGTQMTKMLRCDGEKYYDELFSFACPKFIAASPSVSYNQVLSEAKIALVFLFCIYLL
jgi:translation initiation factor 3 subunit L